MSNNKRNEIIVWPSAMCVDGNYLWIYHGKLNALFKYNLEANDNAEHICSFQDEMLIRESAVSSLICTDKAVYSVPQWGNHIHRYDLADKTESIIHIPDEDDFKDKMLFSGGFLFDGKIYCIPEQYPYVLSVDPETNEVNVEFDIKEYLLGKDISDFLINDSCMGEDGVIYAVILSTNKILAYDVKAKTVNDIFIGEESNRLNTVALDGEDLYISAYNKKLMLKYNTNEHAVIAQYDIPLENFVIRKIANGKILIDSYIDLNYGILYEDKLSEYKSEKSCERVEYPYAYTHGIVSPSKNGYMYFDRYSYKLKKIDSNGRVETEGRYIRSTVEPYVLTTSEQSVIEESSAFRLDWWIDNAV